MFIDPSQLTDFSSGGVKCLAWLSVTFRSSGAKELVFRQYEL
jgi:hypothetical protein